MKKYFNPAFLLPAVYCLLSTAVFSQQDAQYSQYMFNPLALNPAYAGSRDVFSSAIVYRNQWTGIEGSPSTALLALQSPIGKKNAGVAMEVMSDKLGFKSNTALLFSYAYHIHFLKGKLSFGLRTGLYDYVYDWNKAKVKDQGDIFNTGGSSSKLAGTIDFGCYYYTRSFYWGLGLTHLNRGTITDAQSSDAAAQQSIHFFMPIGKAFQAGRTIINPTFLVKGAGGAPTEVDMGVNFLLKERIWLGMSFRARYGVVFMTQYLINEKLKVGYSYDLGLNSIGTAGKGSHEIMLQYDMNIKGTKMEMLRYF